MYDCQSTTFAGLFAGRFVLEATFPVAGGGKHGGALSTILYGYNQSGPVVMNCSFTECEKSHGDAGLTLSCEESHCCSQGWGTDQILNLINSVYGPTLVTETFWSRQFALIIHSNLFQITISDKGVGKITQQW